MPINSQPELPFEELKPVDHPLWLKDLLLNQEYLSLPEEVLILAEPVIENLVASAERVVRNGITETWYQATIYRVGSKPPKVFVVVEREWPSGEVSLYRALLSETDIWGKELVDRYHGPFTKTHSAGLAWVIKHLFTEYPGRDLTTDRPIAEIDGGVNPIYL